MRSAPAGKELPPAGPERFGYRPADAEFLAGVAHLGGFFVRRQYRSFRRVSRGSTEQRFLARATRCGHVRMMGRRTQLCQLRGGALFRALGCRNPAQGGRRRRAVKQRLLALDYWIAQPERKDFLLAPEDKIAHFAGLGIPEECFPLGLRARKGTPLRFPDHFPVRVQGPGRPAVQFAYAHAGSTASGIKRHLERHERLAMALWERGIPCEWILLADGEAQFPRLRSAWAGAMRRAERDWSEAVYFGLRLLAQRREWTALSRDSVELYRQLAAKHPGNDTEQRYRAWVSAGMPPRPPGGDYATSCSLAEVLMEFDYSAAEISGR